MLDSVVAEDVHAGSAGVTVCPMIVAATAVDGVSCWCVIMWSEVVGTVVGCACPAEVDHDDIRSCDLGLAMSWVNGGPASSDPVPIGRGGKPGVSCDD